MSLGPCVDPRVVHQIMRPGPTAATLLVFLAAPALALTSGVRVDALLVSRGLCSNRASAKEAVKNGLVTTRSGAVVRKASTTLDPNAALFIGSVVPSEAPLDSPPPGLELEPAVAAAAAAAAAAAVGGAPEGELELAAGSPDAVHQKRRSTAASRAAQFRNTRENGAPVSGANDNGLQGRHKKRAAAVAGAPKRYSKKNKRGTAD